MSRPGVNTFDYHRLYPMAVALGFDPDVAIRKQGGETCIPGDYGDIQPDRAARGECNGFWFSILSVFFGGHTTAQKHAMAKFCRLDNSNPLGMDFFLDRLPTPEEAKIIRCALGLPGKHW